MQLANAVPGSQAYQKYNAELSSINNRLDELRGKGTQAGLSISSLADKFNKYQALGFSIIATFTGVILSFQKIIDLNGKLSDAQADVMKTTGMTKDEVDELTKSFGALETRTSRIDLLKIAEQGGRIGIAKAEIGSFVEEMNKANVALGDSFTGGVEEVANKLGKLKFLFQETKDANIDTAYNAIGSAINELGANGVASEANITEFATRLGSLPNVLKPTIKEALALGAAFEESGIEAEVSSRAYNIFMKQASTESAKFAKVMGISEQAVKDMINTNPLNFMMKFAEGMKSMDATETAKTLDFLGVNADGANKVIGAMGNNMDRFRELIDISNDSFNDGSSLIDEYNVKNNNLAATLEKVGKKVNSWFSSEGFNNWLFSLVNGFAKLIGATDDVDGSSKKWRNTLVFTAKVIAIITSALITNVGWQKLVALWTTRNTEATLLYTIASKARAVADAIGIISTQAFAAAQMLLTGNVRGATQAFRVMTATLMTTPWGFILGAVAAIGTAYLMFSDSAKEAASAQSMMVQHSRDVDAQLQKESSTFNSLIAVVRDETASTEARSEALEKAKQIGGEYTEGLTLENVATFEGKKAIDAYIGSLKRKIELQVYQAQIDKLIDEIAEKKNKKLDEEVNIWDEMLSYAKNYGNTAMAGTDIVITATQRRSKALEDLQNQLGFTQKQMEEYLKSNPDVIKNIDTGDGTGGGTGGNSSESKVTKNPNSTQEEINRLRLENDSRYNDLLLKNRRQLEDDKIAAMQEGYEKELAIENLRFEREIEDLERQKVHAEEMAKLDEDISKAKQSKDTTKYNALLEIKKGWNDKNKVLDDQINQLIEGKRSIHFLKLATIEEKAAKDAINQDKAEFDRQKVLRETAYYNELAALGNNEEEKEKLRKSFQANELIEEEKFLKELLQKFQTIVGKDKLGKIDLSLLTPEQVAEFQKEAEKVGLTLAQLIEKRNELLKTENKSELDALGLNKSADVLGFTADNWDTLFSNLEKGKFGINEMTFAVQALTNMYAQYSSFLDANENAQLKKNEQSSNKKKLNLKRQLDAGYINQSQYNKAIEKIDNDLDKQKAETEYKQAKRQKAIAAMNVITSTAQAIIGIWAQFPKFDFGATAAIMSGVVGAMGALQLATVLRTPLPARGFEEGLYPVKREQDGKVFQSRFGGKTKSGLVTKPTYFLTGENGPEMIIDSRAYSQISPAVKDALWRELQGIKGFENGMYNQKNQRYEVPVSSPSGSNATEELLKMNSMVMAETLEVLKDLRDSGVRAHIQKDDYTTAKGLKEMIEDYNTLRNKNKI
jgi:tubulin-specific chaperone A